MDWTVLCGGSRSEKCNAGTKANHLVLCQDLSRSLFTVLCAIVLHFFVSKKQQLWSLFLYNCLKAICAWVNIKECQGIYISLHVLSNRTLTCSGIWKPLASVPWVLVYTSLLPVGSTWSYFMQNLIWDYPCWAFTLSLSLSSFFSLSC